jgi:hypothetical protein
MKVDTMEREQATDEFFFNAQEHILKIGCDTSWVHENSPEEITPEKFFGEYIWVVYASGFSVNRLEQLRESLYDAYGDYETLTGSRKQTVLNVINNQRKWNAIYRTARMMQESSWDEFKERYLNSIESMTALDFIGPVTKFHLARNLGYNCAKPDRWMCKIADKLGWPNVDSMCMYLAEKHGFELKEIDIILWEYASDLGVDEAACTK